MIEKKLNYNDFIEHLGSLGFVITIERVDSSSSSFLLLLNNIRIPNDKYYLFGRICRGTYNTCDYTDQKEFTQEDINNAIKECVNIINKELMTLKYTPNYYSCKDYLDRFYGKTKIEKESITRVFNIIKKDFNDIIRFEKNRQS